MGDFENASQADLELRCSICFPLDARNVLCNMIFNGDNWIVGEYNIEAGTLCKKVRVEHGRGGRPVRDFSP